MSSSTVVEKLTSTIECKQKAIRCVRFNADGNYCMTGGGDKSIKLWNPHKNSLLKTYGGHSNDVLDVSGSMDNATLSSCGMDKTVIYWDVATGKLLRKYRGHAAQVNCVKFNDEGTVILSGSVDCSIRAWDCRSRSQDPIQVVDDAKDAVTCLQVTDREIMSGCADGKIRRYDLRRGEMFSDCIGNSVTSVYLSQDGQCILVSTLDNTVRLMDKTNGELLNEYSGHRNTDYKIDSVVSSNDKHILSGSEDGCVYIWDFIEAKVIGKLDHNNRSAAVPSLSFHPTQTCLLTACKDKVYVWKDKYGQSVT